MLINNRVCKACLLGVCVQKTINQSTVNPKTNKQTHQQMPENLANMTKGDEDLYTFLRLFFDFILGSAKVSHAIPGTLNIPNKYDCLYRINLSLISRDVEDFIKKGRLVGKEKVATLF